MASGSGRGWGGGCTRQLEVKFAVVGGVARTDDAYNHRKNWGPFLTAFRAPQAHACTGKRIFDDIYPEKHCPTRERSNDSKSPIFATSDEDNVFTTNVTLKQGLKSGTKTVMLQGHRVTLWGRSRARVPPPPKERGNRPKLMSKPLPDPVSRCRMAAAARPPGYRCRRWQG